MIRKVIGLYYSPAGGTARMTELMAHGLRDRLNESCPHEIECECISLKCNEIPEISRETIVVLGMPTYIGKIPVKAARALKRLDGKGAMTLALLSYSGRSYGNALYELGHLATHYGFELIGAGAIAIRYKSLGNGIGRGEAAETGAEEKRARRGIVRERAAMDMDALAEYADASSAKIKRLGGCDIEGLRVKAAPLEVDGRLPIHRLSRVVPASAAIAQGLIGSIPLGRKKSEWFL
ncbi:MAG: hypothetical protein IKE52_02855 [Mogibacterium sp.]|nr:hypothetical protein [Mogibacterium sp.]